MQIIIREGNASKVFLDLDSDGIKPMLSDYYSFDVPNAKFMPAYRRGVWDGKMRMYDFKTSTFPTGLLFHLRDKFCSNYGIKLVDETGLLKEYESNKSLSMKELAQFVKELNLPFPPYEHQIKPFAHIIKNTRCIIESPTSSGKSLIIYMLTEWIKKENEDGKVLVIVPRISLATQMSNDFLEYNGEEPYKIYSGIDKDNIDNRCIVSTWQSIFNQPKSWFEEQNFRMAIIDECFDGNTLIKTDASWKKIKDIESGDKIINFDEKTKEFKEDIVIKRHENLLKSNSSKMYEMELEDGTKIEVTGNHKFLLKSGEWKTVDKLTLEDELEFYK